MVLLFLYVLLISLELNQPYMFPRVMATLGTVGTAGFLLQASQSVALDCVPIEGSEFGLVTEVDQAQVATFHHDGGHPSATVTIQT